MKPFRDWDEIERLLDAFDAATLPRAEWNHRAHLTVALWNLLHHGPEAGARRIREGIQRYNRANGIEITPEGGYHETLTCFWIRLVLAHIQSSPARETFLALANGLAARLGDKDLPLQHYTRERLFSTEARASWVEPDLKPL